MHEQTNPIPTLYKLLNQLNEAYVDFLVDTGADAFEEDLVDGDPDHSVRESLLKPSFDVNANEKAQRLGYKNLADFIGSELAEEGILQPEWAKEWSNDRLASL